jgi:dihydrofolate reductase
MNTPRISMIAAVAENLAIGKNNTLLWHIPEDLKRFRDITRGHAIVMGSRTFESLGRPLPQRTNVVIAKNESYQAPGCIVAHSLDDAITEAAKVEQNEIFIIGGGSIYTQFLPRADKLYITKVHREFDADTFFPAYEGQFKKITSQQEGEHEGLKYTFIELER